jgi:hypothetical protein
MLRALLCFLLVAGIFVLPLIGATISQAHPLAHYFHFPPEILRTYPKFSLPGTLLIAVLPAAFVLWMLVPQKLGFRRAQPPKTHATKRLPWWGWAGLGLALVMWVVSWTAWEPLRPLRSHAFSPLWLGYILTVDGLVYRRKGHSLASRSVGGFIGLFPASAVLWWLFEYVNRFVQNWYYLGLTGQTPFEYVLFATPSFATVLPALLETAELLGSSAWITVRFSSGPAWKSAGRGSWILAVAGAAGLFCMGYNPTWFFPFAWIGPLMVLAPAVHHWMPERSVLTSVGRGDYRAVVALSLSGPVCGVFWEMWNFFSLPKWEYQVPLVMFAKVFEMPALGYFGYVPFGWECLLIWNAWMLMFGMKRDDVQIVAPP